MRSSPNLVHSVVLKIISLSLFYNKITCILCIIWQPNWNHLCFSRQYKKNTVHKKTFRDKIPELFRTEPNCCGWKKRWYHMQKTRIICSQVKFLIGSRLSYQCHLSNVVCQYRFKSLAFFLVVFYISFISLTLSFTNKLDHQSTSYLISPTPHTQRTARRIPGHTLTRTDTYTPKKR